MLRLRIWEKERNMKDIQTLYNEKLTDAAELASRVESGWLIGMDNAISQPRVFIIRILSRTIQGRHR